MAISKAIDLYGRHCEIATLLYKGKNAIGEDSIPIFDRLLDVWYIAGFLGLQHQRRVTKVEKTGVKTSVFAETIGTTVNISDINLYTTLLVLTSKGFADNEDLKVAMLDTHDEERFDLFHEYALGGLEYIAEVIIPDGLEKIDIQNFKYITSKFEVEIEKINPDVTTVVDDLF